MTDTASAHPHEHNTPGGLDMTIRVLHGQTRKKRALARSLTRHTATQSRWRRHVKYSAGLLCRWQHDARSNELTVLEGSWNRVLWVISQR